MLLNGYFCAPDALTGEIAELAGREGDDAVACGVDGVVGGHGSAFTGTLCQADLADDNLASCNFLTAEQFNAQALALGISRIFGGTASFDM